VVIWNGVWLCMLAVHIREMSCLFTYHLFWKKRDLSSTFVTLAILLPVRKGLWVISWWLLDGSCIRSGHDVHRAFEIDLLHFRLSISPCWILDFLPAVSSVRSNLNYQV
jgi:hypothetical protein